MAVEEELRAIRDELASIDAELAPIEGRRAELIARRKALLPVAAADGSTLRHIARLAGLSHQRVAQVVQSARAA